MSKQELIFVRFYSRVKHTYERECEFYTKLTILWLMWVTTVYKNKSGSQNARNRLRIRSKRKRRVEKQILILQLWVEKIHAHIWNHITLDIYINILEMSITYSNLLDAILDFEFVMGERLTDQNIQDNYFLCNRNSEY